MSSLITLGIIAYVIYRVVKSSQKEKEKAQKRQQEAAKAKKHNGNQNPRKVEDLRKSSEMIQTSKVKKSSEKKTKTVSRTTEQNIASDKKEKRISPSQDKPLTKEEMIREKKHRQDTTPFAEENENPIYQKAHFYVDEMNKDEILTEEDVLLEQFEEKDIMSEVYDIMACGYQVKMTPQRDFVAEGMDMLQRIS